MRFGTTLLVLAFAVLSAKAAPPYRVAQGLFDPARPDDLGLKPAARTQSFVIFRPGTDDPHYNNGVVLFPFKGRLYAQWQTSPKDEDQLGTFVSYSVSTDGVHWAPPQTLASPSLAVPTSGGWWSNGKILVAYINVWPFGFNSMRGGFTEYQTSSDGVHWSRRARVTAADGEPVDGIIEQDPHVLPPGRLITAFHMQPGLIATPFYTDDPLGETGWTNGVMAQLPLHGGDSREMEPSWFRRQDGTLVMVFRDQASSFRQLAAESHDRGEHWMTPVLTDMPDSRAKQSAGNLPDGIAFLVNNPSGNANRWPLAITLSRDGTLFDKAYLLRSGSELSPPRYPGKYKKPGFHYPKSVVWNGYLYVGYAVDKEDVALTRVPLQSLKD